MHLKGDMVFHGRKFISRLPTPLDMSDEINGHLGVLNGIPTEWKRRRAIRANAIRSTYKFSFYFAKNQSAKIVLTCDKETKWTNFLGNCLPYFSITSWKQMWSIRWSWKYKQAWEKSQYNLYLFKESQQLTILTGKNNRIISSQHKFS